MPPKSTGSNLMGRNQTPADSATDSTMVKMVLSKRVVPSVAVMMVVVMVMVKAVVMEGMMRRW